MFTYRIAVSLQLQDFRMNSNVCLYCISLIEYFYLQKLERYYLHHFFMQQYLGSCFFLFFDKKNELYNVLHHLDMPKLLSTILLNFGITYRTFECTVNVLFFHLINLVECKKLTSCCLSVVYSNLFFNYIS